MLVLFGEILYTKAIFISGWAVSFTASRMIELKGGGLPKRDGALPFYFLGPENLFRIYCQSASLVLILLEKLRATPHRTKTQHESTISRKDGVKNARYSPTIPALFSLLCKKLRLPARFVLRTVLP